MKYFIFMDESWNNFEDKYFALWLLFVPDYLVWYLYDDILTFYDKAKDIAQNIKLTKIQEFIDNKQFDQLKNILKSQWNFELKFKNINFTNKEIYKSMINKIWSYKDIQYVAFIINKQSQNNEYSYRESYLNYLSICLSENMDNWNEYIFISDSISQPKWERRKWKEFENYLKKLVCEKLIKKWKNTECFVWAMRVESHASVLLQLTDTILWCIMYFLRINDWFFWEKSIIKKWLVANTLKTMLWNIDFTKSQTVKSPFKLIIKHFN